MASIKTDGPEPESRPSQSPAVASTTKVDNTAPVQEIKWGSDWRETPLFTFLPQAENKNIPVTDSIKSKAPPTGSSVLSQTQKLPSNFTFNFPVLQAGEDDPSSSSGELDISFDTAGPKQEADKAPHVTLPELMEKQTMDRRRQLISHAHKGVGGLDEIKNAPIFTESARLRVERHASSSPGGGGGSGGGGDQVYSQYGLLAGDSKSDELFYYNVAAPSSTFICGSQGSGKSHTLSCLLENSLFPSVANELPRPLTGIVFHYDTFISDSQGSPCEAAYLSTNPAVRVRVLCAPTNIATIRRTYSGLPNVTIEPLSIREQDLTTKRMMDLMAVKKGETMPLYMHVVNRILRDLRLRQQQTGGSFDYRAFKAMLAREDLTDSQRVPLAQRLETLESFMALPQATATHKKNKAAGAAVAKPVGNDWAPRAGQLTIVDLSCPCVTPEGACALFNICLSLFLEQDARKVGRIVALDEAHKYMNESGEATALTEQLLATIRLQRHLGARVVVSTQEPTVSPRLLDLCSVTVVHRFTSPEWLRALRRHLAGVEEAAGMLARAAGTGSGASSDSGVDDVLDGLVDAVETLDLKGAGADRGQRQAAASLFAEIVGLRVGEALVFSPNAVVGVDGEGAARKLGSGMLKVRVRNRVTEDGGRSIMAG